MSMSTAARPAKPLDAHIDFVEGRLDGLRLARVGAYSTRVFACPADRLRLLDEHPEGRSTGCYVAVSRPRPATDGTWFDLYVGEGGYVGERTWRFKGIGEFDQIYFITVDDSRMTREHAGHMERRLIAYFRGQAMFSVKNVKMGRGTNISQRSAEWVEDHLGVASIGLSILGLPYTYQPLPTPEPQPVNKPRKRASRQSIAAADKLIARNLSMRSRGAAAKGSYEPSGFVVHKGSTIAASLTSSGMEYTAMVAERMRLMQDGDIVLNESGELEFARDVRFSSASFAAKLVGGTSLSGNEMWISKGGMTLGMLRGKPARRAAVAGQVVVPQGHSLRAVSQADTSAQAASAVK
jgi:hypothetical protein